MREVEGQLLVTATDLIGHLACSHLTQLNRAAARSLIAAPDRDDPELEIIARRGEEHEQSELERLLASGLEVVRIDGDPTTLVGLRQMEGSTLSAMSSGAEVIYQAAFFDGRRQGRADFLFRTDMPSDLGDWSYEVGDAKLARSLKVAALIQMCDYSAHLTRLQGAPPSRMHALLGDGRTETFAVQDVAAYHRLARLHFERALEVEQSTYPDPVEHCNVCAWRDACEARRRHDDHLSLVAGMRRDQTRKLVDAGISTVLELSKQCPTVHGIQPATLERLHAQAALQVRQRLDGRIHYELLPANGEGRGLRALPAPSPGDLFFDIEGDPYVDEHGLEYLFGVTELVSGQPRFRAYWAHDMAEERRAFEAVLDLFTHRRRDDPSMHIYHYAAYEQTALRRLAGYYATREDALDDLLRAGVFVDLYQVLRQSVRVSTESYSLKSIEPLFLPKREGAITDAGSSIVAYEKWLEDGDQSRLDAIEEYNRADCESTWHLRSWLESRRREHELREGAELDRPAPSTGVQSEAAQRMSFETAVLATALTADVPDDPSLGSDEQQARWLLAALLDWHRREARPEWRAHFERLRTNPDDLYEDTDSIAGLTFVAEVGADKHSVIHRYRFDPNQDFTIEVGDAPIDPETGTSPGTVFSVDGGIGAIDLRRGPKKQLLPHPSALAPGQPYGSDELRSALFRIGQWTADNGIDSPGPYRAARDLLLRNPPRLRSDTLLSSLGGDEPAMLRACRAALALSDGCLPVQGPPGTGKTETAAYIALALIDAGRRVGVTAMSHKAIGNLLDRICSLAVEYRRRISVVQKADPGQQCATRWVKVYSEPHDVVRALSTERVDVVAGTAWLFSRSDMAESIDTLIVDEAGQVSLANAIAISGAARNLILCGDPQQLNQPQRGQHPDGSEASALEHLLAGAKTIPNERGIFLDKTWRLHPSICEFISDTFYEGRLRADESCAKQQVEVPAPSLSGAGLRYSMVRHGGNRVASPEEAERVQELVLGLVGGTVTTREGNRHLITDADVLIVAPYNAHVRRLRDLLPPEARVGTVDRFQGQEAPIVIYSMATSSPQDQRRSMSFLYSLNRFNVALSRAQALVVLVNSPDLLLTRCRTPRELVQANALCRYVELAEPCDDADLTA